MGSHMPPSPGNLLSFALGLIYEYPGSILSTCNGIYHWHCILIDTTFHSPAVARTWKSTPSVVSSWISFSAMTNCCNCPAPNAGNSPKTPSTNQHVVIVLFHFTTLHASSIHCQSSVWFGVWSVDVWIRHTDVIRYTSSHRIICEEKEMCVYIFGFGLHCVKPSWLTPCHLMILILQPLVVALSEDETRAGVKWRLNMTSEPLAKIPCSGHLQFQCLFPGGLLLAASSIPPLWKRDMMRWVSTVQNINDFADSPATIYPILWFIWQVHHSTSVAMNCWCSHFLPFRKVD